MFVKKNKSFSTSLLKDKVINWIIENIDLASPNITWTQNWIIANIWKFDNKSYILKLKKLEKNKK